MSVNLYNSEGYLDTTAYAALTNIEQEARRDAYRPLVFICSPYAGDWERNAQRARDFCRFYSGFPFGLNSFQRAWA